MNRKMNFKTNLFSQQVHFPLGTKDKALDTYEKVSATTERMRVDNDQ